MNRISKVPAFALALMIPAAAASAQEEQCVVDESVQIHDEWRELWTEHVVAEHMLIVSAVEDLKDRDLWSRRLLTNARRMAHAVERYYGGDVEQQLSRLLEQHAQLFNRFVDAAVAGDEERVRRVRAQLFRSGDQIVTILDRAHQGEIRDDDLRDLRPLMRDHLTLSARVLNSRLNGEYDEELSFQEQLLDTTLDLADHFSAQIIEGFIRPDEPFCQTDRERIRERMR